MSEHNSGTDTSVGLIDIASQVPGLLADVPVIVRGVVTGLLAQPTSKTSIGKVFQDRAARYGDQVFLRFGDQQLTYREANATANRYAAVLAARGVGRGDVVGIMLRNSPNAVLMMLAAVKCGAIAGMLNYHQRGEVLAHSLGLLDAKVLVAESDLVDAVDESGGAASRPDDRSRRWSGWRRPRPPPTRRRRRPCWPRTPRSTSSPRAPPVIPRPA